MLCMHSKHAKLGNAMHCTVPARHSAPLEGATVLCMHTRHATPGNANALYRASRHTARLERATVLCMRSKHAKLGNAMHCTVTTRHTAWPKGVTVLCMHARLAGKRCTLRTLCGDSQVRTQRQCPQTPHGGISNTCCLSGRSTLRRVATATCAPTSDVHRHRVVAFHTHATSQGRCTLRTPCGDS